MLHAELSDVVFFNHLEKCGFTVGFPKVEMFYMVKATAKFTELTTHIRDCLLVMENSSSDSGLVYVRSYERSDDQFEITLGFEGCHPSQMDAEILKRLIGCNLQSRLSDLYYLLCKSADV